MRGAGSQSRKGRLNRRAKELMGLGHDDKYFSGHYKRYVQEAWQPLG